MGWRSPPDRLLVLAIRAALTLTASLPLAACRGSETPRAAAPCALPITIAVTPSERLNPDEAGQALPTVVRVFQLSRAVRMEQADFVQLWEQPAPTLGDELVRQQELTVFPGRPERIDLELDPKARFLAAMAVFRQPTGNQWRTIAPLPASERLCAAYNEQTKAPEPALDISLDGYRIEARSFLLRAGGAVDLPADVTSGAEEERVDRSSRTSTDPASAPARTPRAAPTAPQTPQPPGGT